MICRMVPIAEKTKIGTVRNGLVLVMRIEMYNAVTRQKFWEERWDTPSPPVKPLCRPSNGYGQHAADWADAIRRANPLHSQYSPQEKP